MKKSCRLTVHQNGDINEREVAGNEKQNLSSAPRCAPNEWNLQVTRQQPIKNLRNQVKISTGPTNEGEAHHKSDAWNFPWCQLNIKYCASKGNIVHQVYTMNSILLSLIGGDEESNSWRTFKHRCSITARARLWTDCETAGSSIRECVRCAPLTKGWGNNANRTLLSEFKYPFPMATPIHRITDNPSLWYPPPPRRWSPHEDNYTVEHQTIETNFGSNVTFNDVPVLLWVKPITSFAALTIGCFYRSGILLLTPP